MYKRQALQATEPLRGQSVTAAESILKAAATVPHVVAADAIVLAADCTVTRTCLLYTSERPECVTFPDLCFSVILKIAQQHRFVNRLFAEKRLKMCIRDRRYDV